MIGGLRQTQLRVALAGYLLGLLACGVSDFQSPATPSQPDGWARIQGQPIALELAITPQEQALGLGQRDALDWGHGMLFLYEEQLRPRGDL